MVHGQIGDVVVMVCFEKLAVGENGGMFHLRGDNVSFFGFCQNRRMNSGVIALRAAAGEKNLTRRLTTDEVGDFLACGLDLGFKHRTKPVAAGRVSPFLSQIRQYRLAHFWQDRCRGVVVEVNQSGEKILA